MATAGGGSSSGIELAITWNEALASLVLQRDDNNSFTSPTEVAVITIPKSSYTDDVPVDGVTYYYRAKHTKTGRADSAWSSTVSKSSSELP